MQQQADPAEIKEPLASIALQTFIYFDELFSILYFIIAFCVALYKSLALTYPPATIGIEVFLIFAFMFLQFSRLFIGSVGNQTEAPSQIRWFVNKTISQSRFIYISFPIAFLYAYFLRLQTFVIVLEVITNSIGIGFLVFEFLCSIFAYKRFKDYEKTQ